MTNTSEIPFDINLKPGDSALGLNGDTNSRTNVIGQDSMRRWLWATIARQTGSNTILQHYVPVESKENGLTTTYAQEYKKK